MLNVRGGSSFWNCIYIRVLSKSNLFFLNTVANKICFRNIYSISIVACWSTNILLIMGHKLIHTTLRAKELWVCEWVFCYLLKLIVISKLVWGSRDDRLANLLFIYHRLYFFSVVFCYICNTFSTLSYKTFKCQIVCGCKAVVAIHLYFRSSFFVRFAKLVFLQNLFQNCLIIRDWILTDHNARIVLEIFYLFKPDMLLYIFECVTLCRISVKNFSDQVCAIWSNEFGYGVVGI